jgi:flagellar motility protein MotE (MotC chaperone)
LKVLRSQLEWYIAETLGSHHLASTKSQTELRKVKKEIADLKKKLAALQARKAEIEQSLGE